MSEYMINYLDANGQIYPGFAMEWTPAASICSNASCTATVRNIPEALLQGGLFSIQLQAKDISGKVYQSIPVEMRVSGAAYTATPEAQSGSQGGSFLGGFLSWLFGPLLRLLGIAK